MIKVENMEAFNFDGALRGMRNPLNSWDKSDSTFDFHDYILNIGPNDLDLAKRLIKAGPSDRKFLRQIFVSMDVTAPLYWWKEADQYKVSTVTNSCSTMHKLTAKEFELDDFSHDKLIEDGATCGIEPWAADSYYGDWSPNDILGVIIDMLNEARKLYIETKDKKYWWNIIQLLPSSYNQRRTWTLDYETLRGIYHSRKDHKLDEWREFCEIIKTLPYAEDLIV